MLRGHRRGEKEVLVLYALYVSLAAVGGLLLLLGMLGGLLKERTPVSEPLIALLAGVLIGPSALGLLDLADLGDQALILEEAALVTLGVALVGVALRLPVGYSRRNWRLLFVLLGIVMPLMWIVGGLLAYLIVGVPFWVAVMIGAIVTPTDPVVASSIVAGGSQSATCPRDSGMPSPPSPASTTGWPSPSSSCPCWCSPSLRGR
jgi:NhaP-type Na+/H+ or K+/H+ antiporter